MFSVYVCEKRVYIAFALCGIYILHTQSGVANDNNNNNDDDGDGGVYGMK